MLDWLFRRRKADPAPAVKEAIEKRDELFAEAQDAMEAVDRVTGEKASRQDRLLADYKRANGLHREDK